MREIRAEPDVSELAGCAKTFTMSISMPSYICAGIGTEKLKLEDIKIVNVAVKVTSVELWLKDETAFEI